MKSFINRFLQFSGLGLILVVGLILLLSVWHGKVFLPNGQYFCDDYRKVFIQQEPVDLLFLGNSRVLAAIDARYYSQHTGQMAVNLGYLAANMTNSRLTLRAVMDQVRYKPRRVCLEVSWFSFNRARTTLNYDNLGALTLTDPRLLRFGIQYPELFRGFFTTAMRGIVFDPPYTDFTQTRAGQVNDASKQSFVFNLDSMRVLFPDQRAGIDQDLFADYQAIVRLCQQNGIGLILFTAPEDPTYTRSQLDREQIKEIFRKSALLDGVDYLDYTVDGPLYRPEFSGWLGDSHHIFHNELFTPLFIKDLQQLHLIQPDQSN